MLKVQAITSVLRRCIDLSGFDAGCVCVVLNLAGLISLWTVEITECSFVASYSNNEWVKFKKLENVAYNLKAVWQG